MDETLASPLRHCASHGPVTDPGDHAALFDDLPTTVPALCEVIFCHIEIDPLDAPRDQFLVAGRAWQLCRPGQARPDDFGLAPDSMHGLWYVQSQLVRDLAALNKMELLCWDCWGLGRADPDEDLSAEDLALLDRVAAPTQAANAAFGQLRATYENNQRLRVQPVIISYSQAGPRQVDLSGQ